MYVPYTGVSLTGCQGNKQDLKAFKDQASSRKLVKVGVVCLVGVACCL